MITNPIERAIEALIRGKVHPHYLQINNDSNQHRGPRDAESHFSAVIVSDTFAGLSRVERQRRVFGALGDVMSNIHALSLTTLTVDEWSSQGQHKLELPRCANTSSIRQPDKRE